MLVAKITLAPSPFFSPCGWSPGWPSPTCWPGSQWWGRTSALPGDLHPGWSRSLWSLACSPGVHNWASGRPPWQQRGHGPPSFLQKNKITWSCWEAHSSHGQVTVDVIPSVCGDSWQAPPLPPWFSSPLAKLHVSNAASDVQEICSSHISLLYYSQLINLMSQTSYITNIFYKYNYIKKTTAVIPMSNVIHGLFSSFGHRDSPANGTVWLACMATKLR